MATSNSRFLAINAATPYAEQGYQVRILDYKELAELVASCTLSM